MLAPRPQSDPPPLQPTLFEPMPPTVQPETAKGATLAERFAAFDEANPHVYRALVRLALDAKRRGFRQWSINGLFEVLRWEASLSTTASDFKLNNSFRSLYARKIMAAVPELDGFFETRCLLSA